MLKKILPELRRFDSFAVLKFLFLVLISSQAWSEDWVYRLHEGENLTIVKERFLKPEFTPEQLQIYNGIEKDREIPVGTEIRVPIDWMLDQLAGVKVSDVYGEVTFRRRGSNEAVLVETGDILKAGDRVNTGVKSAVSLLFADNSLLLIGESSEVLFDALSSYKGIGMLDTSIRLQRGRIENRVTPFKRPESRYEIHTPAAVTVVRGTDFRVSSNKESALTRSEVTNGKVTVAAQGASVLVTEGEGALVKAGEPPSEPQKLLVAPEMRELSILKRQDALLLEWPELAGAVQYRYQLKDPQQVMISAGVITSPQVEVPLLASGAYHLYLRGIDILGLEGMEGEKLFQLDLEPARKTSQPPQKKLIAPLLRAPKFYPQSLVFEWSSVPDAWSYRFILARDQAFNDIIFERLSFDLGFNMGFPEPGRYYVAVEALIEDRAEKTLSNSYFIELPVWY
jgi:hypothetical protein